MTTRLHAPAGFRPAVFGLLLCLCVPSWLAFSTPRTQHATELGEQPDRIAGTHPAERSSEPQQAEASEAASTKGYRSGDWVPIGEALPRWPEREHELQILAAQARRPRPADKRAVLTRFTQLVDNRSISPFDRQSITVLGEIALEGVRFSRMPHGGPARTSPMIRREAVELLGRIGGPHADEVVRQVMRDDEDLVVLAEAVYAIGHIRSEPDSELLLLLSQLLERNARLVRNDNLAYATLLTVERLHRSSWGIDDPRLFRAIFEIRNGAFIPPVRRKADQVAQLLRQGR